jgi:hypothetical protein
MTLNDFVNFYRDVFEDSIAASITTEKDKITGDNVVVTGITNTGLQVQSQTSSRTSVSLEMSVGVPVVRVVDAKSLLISFKIVILVENTGYTNVQAAFTDITQQLATKVSSGEMLAIFSSAATVKAIALNISIPQEIVISDFASDPSAVTIIVRQSGAPTLRPTPQPTVALQPVAQRFALGYSVIGITVFVLLLLAVDSILLRDEKIGASTADRELGRYGVSTHQWDAKSSSNANEVLFASRLVYSAIPYMNANTKSAFVHHRWLSAFVFELPGRPKVVGVLILYCFAVFQLLFTTILVRYFELVPMDMTPISFIYCLRMILVVWIVSLFGALAFTVLDAIARVYIPLLMPDAASPEKSDKVHPQGSHNFLSSGTLSSVDALSECKFLLQDLQNQRGALRWMDDEMHLNLFDKMWGLTKSGDFIDVKVLRKPSRDRCAALSVISTVCDARVGVRNFTKAIASDASTLRLRKRIETIRAFYLDVLPRFSGAVVRNQIRHDDVTLRPPWLPIAPSLRVCYSVACLLVSSVVASIVVLFMYASTIDNFMQYRILTIFGVWWGLDFIAQITSVYIKHKFLPRLASNHANIVAQWLRGAIEYIGRVKPSNTSPNILGQIEDKKEIEFNAAQYCFISHRLASLEREKYLEDEAILSFQTMWPCRSIVPHYIMEEMDEDPPAMWLYQHDALTKGQMLAWSCRFRSSLYSVVELVLKFPLVIQNWIFDGFSFGLIASLIAAHVALFYVYEFLTLVPVAVYIGLYMLYPLENIRPFAHRVLPESIQQNGRVAKSPGTGKSKSKTKVHPAPQSPNKLTTSDKRRKTPISRINTPGVRNKGTAAVRDALADEIGAEKIVRIHSAGEAMNPAASFSPPYRESLSSSSIEKSPVSQLPPNETHANTVSRSHSGVIHYSASEQDDVGAESERRGVFEEALRWAEAVEDKQHSPLSSIPPLSQRERIRTTGSSGGRKGGLASTGGKMFTNGSTGNEGARASVRYADEVHDFVEEDGKILMSQTTSSIDKDKDRDRSVSSRSSPEHLAGGAMSMRELKRHRPTDNTVHPASNSLMSHHALGSVNTNVGSDTERYSIESDLVGADKKVTASSLAIDTAEAAAATSASEISQKVDSNYATLDKDLELRAPDPETAAMSLMATSSPPTAASQPAASQPAISQPVASLPTTTASQPVTN